MAKAANKNSESVIEMTQAAYDELFNELEMRKTIEREKIASAISDARELGDLSENHAYTVAMEQKELNENRIEDLEILLKNVHIVSKTSSTNVVTIGKSVEITNLSTKKVMKVTLVGSEETEAADPSKGMVSIDSPIGKAIQNASTGDTVVVMLPVGQVEYKVGKLIA